MILRRIERYLTATGMKPSVFGRLAAGDPRLVFDLRKGREAGPALRHRLERFMEQGR